MGQVAPLRTPLTMAQQAQGMTRAWRDALGQAPRALIELSLAHVALENKQGSAIWNNNPGNLTTNAGTYYVLDSISVNSIGERIAQDDPDRVVLHFWPFDTPAEGFAGYVNWLQKHPALLQAGIAGDPDAFAAAIKSTGYTPYINVARIGKSLAAMVAQIRAEKLLQDYELPGPGVVTPGVSSAGSWGALLIGATLAVIFGGKVVK
jgi:hypothetical protein